jgi:hypothetical protein
MKFNEAIRCVISLILLSFYSLQVDVSKLIGDRDDKAIA